MTWKQQTMALIQANRLAEAKVVCTQHCDNEPGNFEAWFILGAINGQLGEFKEAEICCRRCVALHPGLPGAHYNLGISLLRQGKSDEAALSFQHALKLKPDFTEAHNDLGNALQAQGHADDAVNHYKQAIRFNPDFAEAHNNLGLVLQAMGKLDDATECFQAALRSQRNSATMHFNLGNVLYQRGMLAAATESLREATRIQPDFEGAHRSLGQVLGELGRYEEAVRCYQMAAKLNPESAETHNYLGNLYLHVANAEAAVEEYSRALELQPDRADTYESLAKLYFEQGKHALAAECCRKIIDLTDSDGARIRLATLLPLIPESGSQIDDLREALTRNVNSLLGTELHVKDPTTEIGIANFLLAYHGKNDRNLQQALAQLYIHACPSLSYTARHCADDAPKKEDKRIRIGFISRYLRNHSIGKTSKGIIANLSRDLFEVIVFFLDHPQDETAKYIAQHADIAVVLPNDLEGARKRIEEFELDILFYQDIGMDYFTFFLAFSRLAPVQCTSFGHPVTTGIPNMDYYISTECWEPENADEHYSERLVRLRNVSSVAYYYRPHLLSPLKSRSHFGLNEQEHIYVCPQTLFKFHPEFDELLGNVLRMDPNGRIVLIEGLHRSWGGTLRRRFEKSIPDVMRRIEFLPSQDSNDFINLIAVSDVMLDTIHFCGFNTSLEAFAVGTPVVTLPGKFMRGRHTFCFYKRMELMDCVAASNEDYVRKAVRLGTDQDYRMKIRQKILDSQSDIWEENEVVREFERFFIKAVRETPLH